MKLDNFNFLIFKTFKQNAKKVRYKAQKQIKNPGDKVDWIIFSHFGPKWKKFGGENWQPPFKWNGFIRQKKVVTVKIFFWQTTWDIVCLFELWIFNINSEKLLSVYILTLTKNAIFSAIYTYLFCDRNFLTSLRFFLKSRFFCCGKLRKVFLCTKFANFNFIFFHNNMMFVKNIFCCLQTLHFP